MNGSPDIIPAFFQSNVISLKVQCVNPSLSTLPLGSTTYSIQNMGTFGMRAAVGAAPAGTPGQVPVALQNAMVWDNTNQWFTGDLPLNTTGVDALIGANASTTAYFELNLTILGTRITILQTTLTLKAVVDELVSLVPTPTEQYRTAAESDARYMPRVGEAGAVLTLTSPNGLIKVELGIDNNGQFTTNIIS